MKKEIIADNGTPDLRLSQCYIRAIYDITGSDALRDEMMEYNESLGKKKSRVSNLMNMMGF